MVRKPAIRIILAIILVTLLHPSGAAQGSTDPLATKRWSKEKAWAWYDKIGPMRGCNYLPRTAVNSTEMWQAETFDANTIDQELGWAHDAGYNNIRVFLQYIVWKAEPKKFKKRVDKLLAIAAKNEISVMLMPFCDCAFAGKEPYLGKQNDPVPGVHNSQWVPSPGLARVTDRSVWSDLERYIKDIVGTFAKDSRVIIWDLYNEPGNSNLGEKSLPLVEQAFKWAREVNPSQPLTVAAWTSFEGRMSNRLMELSDIVSFHGYGNAQSVEATIEICQKLDRPIICSEWLRRQVGNTFEAILPLFAKHKVGWQHWGLVAGRTQTYMHWGSKEGDPVPRIWQHDVFSQDGVPYNSQEIEMVRSFRFAK